MPKSRNSSQFKGPVKIWRKQNFPQIADGWRHEFMRALSQNAVYRLSISMFVL